MMIGALLRLRSVSEPSTEAFNSRAAPRPDTLDWGWAALLAASRYARSASPAAGYFTLGGDGNLAAAAAQTPGGALELRRDGTWVPGRALPGELGPLLDLYLPFCGSAPLAIAHLGQSIDGYVATRSGDSSFVNGPENILHLHRMRALADAVIVGAGTIAADDPRLTTRLAPGKNPVRVILDPGLRLSADRRVFTDGEAETFLVCSAEITSEPSRGSGFSRDRGRAEVLDIPVKGTGLDLVALLDALHVRGLQRLFVEGGGTTVSRFLEAGLLDRLQIAVGPLIMGGGRPGLKLPAGERIAECLRPAHRIFAMGGDVLFDCDLRTKAAAVDREINAAIARIY
jgi:riboflavin-specific deaminase-like protein